VVLFSILVLTFLYIRSWLKFYAVSWKVADSSPDDIIDFFLFTESFHRVTAYKSRGPGSSPSATRFSEK
jgi:hypothetical protein